MVGDSLSRASAFRVGLGVGGAVIVPGFALAHRARVMDHGLHTPSGCVVWVRWTPPWYLGWYGGPGLSLRCFSRFL
jgi:hypothetical protein